MEEEKIGGVVKEVTTNHLPGATTRETTIAKAEVKDYYWCPPRLTMIILWEGKI